MKNEKIEYEIGSGNVFKDLGIPNPEEYLAKTRLAFIIEDLIAESGLGLDEVAKIINLNTAKLSTLLDGLLDDFSIDHLFSLSRTLDCNIETAVRGVTTAMPEGEIYISMPEPANSPVVTISLVDLLGKPSSLKIAVAA
jgi:predicted XRE-type DNA-binding protein